MEREMEREREIEREMERETEREREREMEREREPELEGELGGLGEPCLVVGGEGLLFWRMYIGSSRQWTWRDRTHNPLRLP
jgi:hypothetical protein